MPPSRSASPTDRLLITGGAGFIGSHTALVLLEAGQSLVVLDDLSNGSSEALRRVAQLAGLAGWRQRQVGLWATDPGPVSLVLRQGDIRSPGDLAAVFSGEALQRAGLEPGRITAVLHFAGLKSVPESVGQPLRYWDVNVGGSRSLFEAMARHECRTVVFSSSASIYGLPETVPIPETTRPGPINPYGGTKAAAEQLLRDLAISEPGWRIALLRYFNPVGAHPSGRIGEDPCGPPNNLFPFVCQVAVGRRGHLPVYGSDWPTPDGTGVRDFIHVMDLAEGHRAAMEALEASEPRLITVNLGSGRGHSVLEVVHAFEAVTGRSVPYRLMERRSGDAPISVADASLAASLLGWRTRRDLVAMCRDGWAWQCANPRGFNG